MRLRALRPSVAGGPSVRRRGRHGAGPRRDRELPLHRAAAALTSATARVVDDPTLDWLADYRFTGDVWGYGEGDIYFPGSPLLVVDSTFAEAVVLETLLLSIFNHDSAVAVGSVADDARRRRSAVHRDGVAAHPRGCGRRGCPGGIRRRLRRNLQPAGRARVRHSDDRALPHTRSRCCTTPSGTRSRRRSTSLGHDTTLLVDTYDIRDAVRTGIEVAGAELGAVRIDSGDLARAGPSGTRAARRARRDLDAHHRDQRPRRVRHRGLAAAPVDGYGVGTSLVTGSGHPTCGFVYKLVARAASPTRMRPWCAVAKKSSDKLSHRWPEVGTPSSRRPRDRRAGADRHRREARSTTATTVCCCTRWCRPARSSDASRSAPPGAAPGRGRRAADGGPQAVSRRAAVPTEYVGRDRSRAPTRSLDDRWPAR